MTPAAENIRGTSALPYHILAGRDKDVEVELYSYNLNKLTQEQIEAIATKLDIKIYLFPIPWWYTLVLKFLLPFRIFLKNPIGSYIHLNATQLSTIVEEQPDGIWIYGEELSRVSKQLSRFNRVHTLPDCESLYYYRMLGKRFAMRNKMRFWRSIFMYPKYLDMEKHFDISPNIHYHLVGEEDVKFLKEISPNIQAHFIRHPHYQIAKPAKNISFSPKIKLLIAGQYNLYMQQDIDELVDCLCTTINKKELSAHYIITFLGKGWEHHVGNLAMAGYEVYHTGFVPNYIDEIVKHDMQITPISIGTGTKGKVLDALANGLLVIGSWYALENIAVEDHVSCLQYKDVGETIALLKDIYSNPFRYEEIAEHGRRSVLELHNSFSVARQLFSLLKK